ncbi:unnamed protein product [Protopolystoma xenopodis]|uniref:Pleckstrin homology domain-containing protein n=1 Tax=Protopolystoma xenopodis TaxID=117903 RepID=A0A3S5CMD8_9PLAT|nr:unnamed protein product [Protopolystoma xenopodis]
MFLEDNSASVPYSSSSATCYLPSSVLGLPGVSTDSTDSKPISPLPSPPAPVPQPLASTIAQTPPPPPQPPPPEAVIRIAHALASRANDYTKKANVFRLTTKDGAEYLFQVK